MADSCSQRSARTNITTHQDADDTGMEILPGVVCVDLTVADVGALTVNDLQEAMAEADAQEYESNLGGAELLGDLDINPL